MLSWTVLCCAVLCCVQVLVLGPPRSPLSSRWEPVCDLTQTLKQHLVDTDWKVSCNWTDLTPLICSGVGWGSGHRISGDGSCHFCWVLVVHNILKGCCSSGHQPASTSSV